jgi:RNA polymerase sigma-70 factor (ECF subfamily)
LENKTSQYHQSESQITSEELIIKEAIKNPRKFAPIYDKYYLQIFKYTLQRVNNEHTASEIVSDVFAKAIYNLPKYKFKGYPFSAWLYRVAYNEITNRHRKNKSTRTVNIPIESLPDFEAEESKEEDLLSMAKMKSCMKLLKPNDIEFIELRFFEKRSFKEIGEILEITTDNARVKTHRALTKLKKLFKKK